jgi:hypothetical protein
MRTMKQWGSFGQQRRAYAKAPLGIRVYGILSMRQNACNRFHTALYEHVILRAQHCASVLAGKPTANGIRNRSQHSQENCGQLRSGACVNLSRRTCDLGQEATERGSRIDQAEHLRSLHEKTRCCRAQSSGSRFLAAGLLPLLRLRCFACQGLARLAQSKPCTSPVLIISHTRPLRIQCPIKRQLLVRCGLSHARKYYDFSGTSRLAELNLTHQLWAVCS